MFNFYPILRAPNCNGFTVVHNYPPNNWEIRKNFDKYINITWSDGFKWNTKIIGTLAKNKSYRINEKDLNFVPNHLLALSSLSINKLPTTSDILPEDIDMKTNMPEWRATIGLESELGGATSFQGEAHAFPSNGSILSFAPFLQQGKDLSSYLLFISIEKSPLFRHTTLFFLDAYGKKIMIKKPIISNHLSTVKLDEIGYRPSELIVLTTENIVGIPLFMTAYKKGKELSLEHTHPPASFALHGNRWGLHKELKEIWTKKLININKRNA
tara:strand:- start:25 stop:831 length:807 start_codon:yes stop_codon:yes gene_type:complete